jgi:hypothetical protein
MVAPDARDVLLLIGRRTRLPRMSLKALELWSSLDGLRGRRLRRKCLPRKPITDVPFYATKHLRLEAWDFSWSPNVKIATVDASPAMPRLFEQGLCDCVDCWRSGPFPPRGDFRLALARQKQRHQEGWPLGWPVRTLIHVGSGPCPFCCHAALVSNEIGL